MRRRPRGRHLRRRRRIPGLTSFVVGLCGLVAAVGLSVISFGVVAASPPQSPSVAAPPAVPGPTPGPLPAPQSRELVFPNYVEPPGSADMVQADRAWIDYEWAHEARLMLRDHLEHPPLPADSGEGKRVVYSNSEQRVWLVGSAEKVLDSYPVSGRRGTPRPGTYEVFSRSELAWAGHDGITMQYMVRFAHGSDLAIGFHSIPVAPSGRPIQTDEDLGNFRSAGCVRQSLADAAQLYLFADVGTTVVVTP